MSIALAFLTVILIFVSLFLILVVLAQKAKDGGMGAALGGGAAEAAFGAETGNVLSRSTIYAAIIFFVGAFALYLGRIYERKHAGLSPGDALPNIAVPAVPKSSTPAPTTTVPLSLPASTPPATATPPAQSAPVTSAPATTPAPVEPAKKP